MNNKFSIMNLWDVFFYCLLAVLLSIIQTTLFPRIPLFDAVPDIVLAALCCIGIYRGENYAASFGLFAGLCVDGLGSTGVSLLPLFYTLVGYFCGRVGANTRNGKHFAAYLLTFPLFCLARSAVTFILNVIFYFGSIEWERFLLSTLLAEYVYTLILCVPVFLLVKLFELPTGFFRRKGGSY